MIASLCGDAAAHRALLGTNSRTSVRYLMPIPGIPRHFLVHKSRSLELFEPRGVVRTATEEIAEAR